MVPANMVATGHVTFAETVPDTKNYPGALPHMVYAGSLFFTPPDRPVDLKNRGEWWSFVKARTLQDVCVLAFILTFSYILTLSPLHAQGDFSTPPYCAQYADGTSLDCSFSTLSQCYESVSGVGGVCIDNPTAAGAASAANPQRPFGSPYAFAPSSVPPPPMQQSPTQQSQGPLQLPGPPPTEAQAPASAGLGPPPPCNPLYNGTYCASASSNSLAPISSLSSDLAGASPPSATLGGSTFSGNTDCIGILRQMSCGGF
jgi:uncharacterized protein DUF3551